jgi:quinol-cytochrome oxidoreductase complex cytochrome b subunit
MENLPKQIRTSKREMDMVFFLSIFLFLIFFFLVGRGSEVSMTYLPPTHAYEAVIHDLSIDDRSLLVERLRGGSGSGDG